MFLLTGLVVIGANMFLQQYVAPLSLLFVGPLIHYNLWATAAAADPLRHQFGKQAICHSGCGGGGGCRVIVSVVVGGVWCVVGGWLWLVCGGKWVVVVAVVVAVVVMSCVLNAVKTCALIARAQACRFLCLDSDLRHEFTPRSSRNQRRCSACWQRRCSACWTCEDQHRHFQHWSSPEYDDLQEVRLKGPAELAANHE